MISRVMIPPSIGRPVKHLVDFSRIRSVGRLVFPDVEEMDFIGILGNMNRMAEEGTPKLDKKRLCV
jgi:hypothetical protein